jgi:hypothetical protein
MASIDLHTHSDASDGVLAPAALVKRAAAAGVGTLAVTDHDTVAGLAAAHAASLEAGIRLVPGTELSVRWEGRTLHVLGLGIDPTHAGLVAGLARLGAARAERAAGMLARLARSGAPVDSPVPDLARLTRTHLARALVAAGHARDLTQAFHRWLARGRPGHVAGEWADLADAVAWIKAAGGVAVLAHPARYKLSGAWMRRLLTAFKDAGGEAIEVAGGQSGPAEILHLGGLARRHGLAASAGSDFHGPQQPWLQLGRIPALPADLETVWERHGWAA